MLENFESHFLYFTKWDLRGSSTKGFNYMEFQFRAAQTLTICQCRSDCTSAQQEIHRERHQFLLYVG